MPGPVWSCDVDDTLLGRQKSQTHATNFYDFRTELSPNEALIASLPEGCKLMTTMPGGPVLLERLYAQRKGWLPKNAVFITPLDLDLDCAKGHGGVSKFKERRREEINAFLKKLKNGEILQTQTHPDTQKTEVDYAGTAIALAKVLKTWGVRSGAGFELMKQKYENFFKGKDNTIERHGATDIGGFLTHDDTTAQEINDLSESMALNSICPIEQFHSEIGGRKESFTTEKILLAALGQKANDLGCTPLRDTGAHRTFFNKIASVATLLAEEKDEAAMRQKLNNFHMLDDNAEICEEVRRMGGRAAQILPPGKSADGGKVDRASFDNSQFELIQCLTQGAAKYSVLHRVLNNNRRGTKQSWYKIAHELYKNWDKIQPHARQGNLSFLQHQKTEIEKKYPGKTKHFSKHADQAIAHFKAHLNDPCTVSAKASVELPQCLIGKNLKDSSCGNSEGATPEAGA